MKQRIITGVLLIIGVIIFVGLGGLPLQLMCALIALIASKEIMDVTKGLPKVVQGLVYLFTLI